MIAGPTGQARGLVSSGLLAGQYWNGPDDAEADGAIPHQDAIANWDEARTDIARVKARPVSLMWADDGTRDRRNAFEQIEGGPLGMPQVGKREAKMVQCGSEQITI